MHLKTDPLFVKVSVFMKMLRAMGAFLYELDSFIIKGYYSNTHIAYYKEETEELYLYYKDNASKYRRQKVSLTRPALDEQGNFQKSKNKAITALVANYVHFLDALICHYIIDNLPAKAPLGTIHDSFFVKPADIPKLKEKYKEGLILAQKTHVYNLFNWLHIICTAFKEKNRDFAKLVINFNFIKEASSI